MNNKLAYGIIGFGSTGFLSSSIYYLHKYEEFKCGDLKIGIAVGILSLLSMILNIIYLISSCCSNFYKCFMHIFGLTIIGSLGYNLYLYENIEDKCVEYYKEKNLWNYYLYLLIILGINSILIILVYMIKFCIK